jgi:hypothetical protein
MSGRGELAVVLLVGEGREGRREAMGMRKTKLGSKFLLPRHAQVTPCGLRARESSHAVLGP